MFFFFTNDLALTLSKEILPGDSDEAIKATNGVSHVCQWIDKENIAQKPFWAPNIMIAYDKFIGGIDQIN